MKPLHLFAASALALTAAACGPKTPPVRAALDCPATEGELTRTSATPDGKACTYVAADGGEVTLQLVSVRGTVDDTLQTFETNLLAQRSPAPAEGGDAKAKAADDAGAAAAGTAAKAAEAQASLDAGQTGVRIEAGADGKGVHVKVDGNDAKAVNVETKDGKTVVTESGDGTTRINLPGIHIVANENDDSAKVEVGPIKIDAGGDSATIRMRRDVRLRGEALNPDQRGFRATFIYTGKDLPSGYRAVGYEAGGPKQGPFTIAVVKSKLDRGDAEAVYDDVKKLVRRNGGV
ncbi:MAG: hypothetical protein JNK30_08045 [Phenylobacterium sp.]|uniref:hypothetical protein n=1 Tax=Phenylobacterium sp. TaxID=1871053 RepID=UPI001A609715|nr:hypothetical protein [Phenylobacterium sp.]MBL8771321.1 hypothetical protein [Phenylobacterium sp.]